MSLSAEDVALAEGVRRSERRALAKAITLLESTRRDDRSRADALLNSLLSSTGKSRRLGISGVPGAGKSTLLQVVCGVLQPSLGQRLVRGRIAALLELGAGFNPELTGRENVRLNGPLLGLSSAEVERRMDAIVDFAGIEEYIDQPVRSYSSGMFMRLAFSMATSMDPEILVVDEALSVGDGAFARKSYERIMALKDKGTTILFCSHSMFQVESLCTRALWIEAESARQWMRTATGDDIAASRASVMDRGRAQVN